MTEMMKLKNNVIKNIKNFIYGDFTITTKRKHQEERRSTTHHELTISERYSIWKKQNAETVFKNIYKIASVMICFVMIIVLTVTVSFLPEYGNPNNPVHNEVSQRYLEQGMQETGAVNIVAGMILDYRAFDTFGESAVLFVASIIVLMIMREDKSEERSDKAVYVQMKRDTIVKNIAKYIIPFLLIFGIYVVLNGHISPGGGFAGGAIMGAGLILYSSAYGYKTINKYINAKFVKYVTFGALGFYAIAKSYSFYTGAHHIETGIPLGIAGNILSGGLILPLNICVGLIVMCTMYSFYSLFSKGEI